MEHACDIRTGLPIAPGLSMRTREQPNGSWLAWIEHDGQPLCDDEDRPRSFTGHSCYAAQCEAARWLRQHGLVAAPCCGECEL